MSPLTRRVFLEHAARFSIAGAALPALSLIQGCVGSGVTNTLSYVSQYAGSAVKVYQSGSKAFEDITPEQEYYIGRTIGALILNRYQAYNNTRANRYVNVLGQTLASFSDLPMLYDGYHFQLLDAEEINAFATPSGLVFVTRGLVHCCTNETALAAVLAHEIGHIQDKHGLEAIEKSRWTDLGTTLALEGTKQFGSAEVASLTDTFESSIDDIASTMINTGFSRADEEAADRAAVTILRRTGYNPTGLVDMLQVMEKKLKPGGMDFVATHPSPASRIEELQDVLGRRQAPVQEVAARQKRFKKALQGV